MKQFPIDVTLKKEDFLHKYPDVFSKLVWHKKQCVVRIWEMNNTFAVVTSAGAFGFIDIPTDAMKKYLTN